MAWDFVAGSSGCQPGDTVSVRVDNNAMVLHPNCTDMGVVTPALDPGTHTVDIALYDANNALIEASPVQNVAVCGDVSAGTYDFSS